MINFVSQHNICDVPCGDKSVSHRALILAAIADGQCKVENISLCDDVLATADCLRTLGAKVEIIGTTATVTPISRPNDNVVLNCRNSGTTARLLAGLVAGLGVTATFVGDDSLSRRPMQRVLQPLSQMGVRYRQNEGLFTMLPATLHGAEIFADTNSAQVKSAVLLAGLFAEGQTVYHQQLPTRNHTEIMLRQFGVAVQEGHSVSVQKSHLRATNICVPQDISSVAFSVALALLCGQKFTWKNVGVNPRRTGFLRVLQNSGAKMTFDNRKIVCGEEVADICLEPCNLKPLFAHCGEVCDGIDEVPLLVALALATKGKHLFCDVSELQYKESNRIAALQKTAEILGQKLYFDGENLVVESNGILPQKPRFLDFSDHRIAMCQAVLALSVCGGGSVDNGNFSVSFPNFLQAVGVRPLRFALLGCNIGHSLSPLLMGHFAARANVCCSYEKVPLPADVSDEMLLGILRKFDGVNITMPFKKRVAKLLFADVPSVNTVSSKIALSTDGYGVVQALKNHKIDFAQKPLWIVGAGGAAEACIAELQQFGCQIQVINRTAEHAKILTEKYGLTEHSKPFGILSFVPQCSFEEQLELPNSVQFVFVADYAGTSGLAKKAKKKNIPCVEGLEMLYHQGAKSFALWTDSEIQNDFESFFEVQNENTVA